MSERINERSRLKRYLKHYRNQIVRLANKIGTSKSYPYEEIVLIKRHLDSLEATQRDLNALAYTMDEKSILAQSRRRLLKSKRLKRKS